jgi:hypothetical protein
MRKTTQLQYGPKDFLAALDITPAYNEDTWRTTLWDMLEKAGIDPELLNTTEGWTDPGYFDLYFATPEIAKHSLRHEYKRYRKTLQWLDAQKAALGQPKQIVDLGCGPGVFSLWLAKMFPESRVVAVDLSPKSIETATAYAALLEITNVTFKVLSFEELLADNTLHGTCDLLFSSHALSVTLPAEARLDDDRIEVGKMFSYSELSEEQLHYLCSGTIAPYCCALRQLSSDHAKLIIDDKFYDKLLLWSLCYGLQQTRFGIDWSLSKSEATGEVHENYLVLTQGLSRCGMLYNDWALAFSVLELGTHGQGKIQEAVTESYLRVLDGYPSIRLLQLQWHSGGTEEWRLKLVGGMLITERVTTLGYRECRIQPLSCLGTAVGEIEQALKDFREKAHGKVVKDECQPDLITYVNAVYLEGSKCRS